jgi:hypothetical protein
MKMYKIGPIAKSEKEADENGPSEYQDTSFASPKPVRVTYHTSMPLTPNTHTTLLPPPTDISLTIAAKQERLLKLSQLMNKRGELTQQRKKPSNSQRLKAMRAQAFADINEGYR